MKRSDYPDSWAQLRAAVRERAGDRCEAQTAAGHRCYARHRVWYHRQLDTPERLFECASGLGFDCTGRDVQECYAAPVRERPVQIILTCAHTCHDAGCDDVEHLLLLCQWHHFHLDREQHAATRRRHRQEAVRAAGQLALEERVLP